MKLLSRSLSTIFIFLIFYVANSYGQNKISGTIRTSDGEVIPYVTMTVNDTKILSDAAGNYQLSIISAGNSDSVLISCIGFQSQLVSIEDLIRQPDIILSPVKYQLGEVTINADITRRVREKWGNTGRNFLNKFSSRVNDICALYIENPTGKPQIIQSIQYFIKEPAGGSHDGPFRVRVYSRDPTTGAPEKDLLVENLIVRAKRKNSWFYVDVSKYQIEIPKEGFFVAMEILPEQSYDVGRLKGKKNSYQNSLKMPCLGLNQAINESRSWVKNEFARGDKNWRVFDASEKPANFMINALILNAGIR